METYDVIILGGGAAGLTSAIYTTRYNLSTLLIAKSLGGTTNLAHEIENWPGFVGSGMDLMKKFREQAESFGAEIKEVEIKSISKKDNIFSVETEAGTFLGKTLIVALGTEHRKLKVEGEEQFLGKGVSYCATCDGNFFRNKTLAVVGGANSAASAALYLSTIAKKVYVIYRRDKMRCEPISLKKLGEKRNVELVYFANPTKILGDKKVQKIVLDINSPEKTEREIDLDGIFIEIGATPLTKIVEGLGVKVNCDGYIEVDRDMKTSTDGVFAAGDNTDGNFKQVTTAVGEGALAANSAYEYLEKKAATD